MSVAFRRDSDEEHLEPKFDIPIPPGPNMVTARGLTLIRDQVTRLEALLPTITDETELAVLRRDLILAGTAGNRAARPARQWRFGAVWLPRDVSAQGG